MPVTGDGTGAAQLLGARSTRSALALPPGAAGPRAGAERESQVTRGTFAVHADLHNHTWVSDGAGDPARAYGSLRDAGLDVAALTDHVHFPEDVRAGIGSAQHSWHEGRERYSGRPRGGLDPAGWGLTGALADAHDDPGEFTAIRGFEWTEPWLGHVNVWFSPDYTPVMEVGSTRALLDWLTARPADLPGDAGRGATAIAGFNHPGREPGRFGNFALAPAAVPQLVTMEIFNRYDDYLFERFAQGVTSPLVACLDAGWRPGLIGVTDEHEDDWGYHEGKGRAGLWVREHSRPGVYEALRARRCYATRVPGLRLDATAGGARMGGTLRHRSGLVEFVLDVDRGAEWAGRELEVQVLRPGAVVPEVADVVPLRLGTVARFTVPLRHEDGGWVVLRVADPALPNGLPGPPGHPANNFALAYSSPWYLDPGP